MNPDNNSNGEAFGLWVALPTGGDLIELPVFEPGTARVQVIHNSADAAATTVDVWLDDTLLLDDFTFRTASPFVDAPAGVNFTIAIKGPDSTDPNDPIWSQDYTLEDGETYVLVANGIVSASGYDPVEPFDIYVYPMGREMATDMDNTDVLVFHGSTDAPTVDVVEIGQGAGTIVDNLMYGMFDGYLELPTADYILDIRDETGMQTVASFVAPLSSLGLDGEAIVVVASGFLTPENNSGGPAFGLYAALPAGGDLVALGNVTGTEENLFDESQFKAYPNPATSFLNVEYSLLEDTDVSIAIYDILGRKLIEEVSFANANSRMSYQLNTGGLDNGLYILTLNAGENLMSTKIRVVN